MTLLLALALFLQPAELPAQRGSLTLQGTVKDATGRPFPGATVSIRSRKGGLPRATITDALGRYSLPKLWDGSYTLSAEAPDFKMEITSVELPVATRIDLTLKVLETSGGGLNPGTGTLLDHSAKQMMVMHLVSQLWNLELRMEDLEKSERPDADFHKLIRTFHFVASDAVPVLIEGLNDDDAQVRRNVCVILLNLAGHGGIDIAEAVPTLARGYRDPDPTARKWALQVLQKVQATR